MLAIILVVGAILLGWELVHGLRTGTMDVAWIRYAAFTRAKQPVMFWMAAVLNLSAAAGAAFYALSLMGA